MSALKNKIISHNIHNFLEVNLLVLFFNYNHISIEEWRIIKSELAKIEKVSTLVVKNQIANTVIKKSKQYFTKDKKESTYIGSKKKEEFEGSDTTQGMQKLSTLFQGPTFLMGITSLEKCNQVFDLTKKHKKLIFVGGLYQEQTINHLDLDYLLKVHKFVYPTLLSNIQYSLHFPVITTPLVLLCNLLEFHQNVKQKEL